MRQWATVFDDDLYVVADTYGKEIMMYCQRHTVCFWLSRNHQTKVASMRDRTNEKWTKETKRMARLQT